MKYTIIGFNQEEAVKLKLDLNDLHLLRWFTDFHTKMSNIKYDNQIYYWVDYKKVFEDLPILSFKSKDRLYRRLTKMAEKEILIHYCIKNKDGSFSYYGFGNKFKNLENNRCVEKTVPHTLKKTEHNNKSIKKYNNICPSKDEQDKSSLEEKDLANNFDLIWKIYPRKDGKNTAFTHYKAWLKGKKYAGRTIKLTNRQMWNAVKEYSDLMEKNKTERQYIKMGSTFFNDAIIDFVEEKI